MKLRVALAGAAGRMGRTVARAVLGQPDLELVGAVDPAEAGEDMGSLLDLPQTGIILQAALASCLDAARADVLIDFTHPSTVKGHALAAIARGVRPVIGTTGLTLADIEELAAACRAKGLGAVVAPNFAIGAMLLMRFAELAAAYLPSAGILEIHHERKVDRPSGTALRLGEAIGRGRSTGEGSGGSGLEIHSLRMQGVLAQHHVHFGGPGETLVLTHESVDRDCFLPGLLLAVRSVMTQSTLIVGLDALMGLRA
ncbi:MAG: 4-hydroxy-tetrahydrodipicolinate reductase [Bacillota bacterium]